MLQETIFPSLVSTQQGRVCGCDMCYDPEFEQVRSSTGPHDLHCLCFSCLSNPLSDYQNDQAFAARYPGYQPWVPEETEQFDLTQAQVNQILADFNYEPPIISPTNQEMHSQNGNGDHYRRLVDYVQNPANRFYAGALSQAALLSGGLLYSGMTNMAKPLSELRQQLFGGPTNKEMHSYNGNLFSIGTKLSENVKLPHRTNKNHYDGPLAGIESTHKLSDHVDIPRNKKARLPDESRIKRGVNPPLNKLKDIIKDGPVINNSNVGNHKWQGPIRQKDHSDEQQFLKKLEISHPNEFYKDHGNYTIGQQNAIISHNLKVYHRNKNHNAPTNKSMHAYNGNPKNLKFKQIKKGLKKIRKGIKKINKKPQVVVKKQVSKKESQEKVLAKRYANFLNNPVVNPPRLGSTGILPTKIIHGYWEQTFLMGTPNLGNQPTATGQTELIAFLSPTLFASFTSGTNYKSPITFATGNAANIALNGSTTASSLSYADFANSASLKNETGLANSSADQPMLRYLGGHISMSCRCPISTTAPPFVFAGLLPMNRIAVGSPAATNPAAQLTQFSTNTIRTFACTDEDIHGMDVSSVYVPPCAEALGFNNNYGIYNTTTAMPPWSIPYVGMSGCPTTASVTLRVSAFYELQYCADIGNYGGWSKGPKVSAEDIFDYLPNIKPVKNKVLNLGNKSTAGTMAATVASQMKAALFPEPTIDQKLQDITTKYNQLKVMIEDLNLDREDEKFILSPSDTPRSHVTTNLSQSTIDLALSAIKDRLTPGSVTSKTVPTRQI